MKKLLNLLLVLFAVLISALVTFLVVSKIDSARLDRTASKYEEEIAKLEKQVRQLQTAVGVIPAVVTNSTPTQAPSRVRHDASTVGSKCRIDGTSSIHDWKMETAIIGGFFEIDSKVKFDTTQTTLTGSSGDGLLNAAAEATIPVRSLKSYNTKMDEVYQDHMEAIAYRKIEYRLKSLALKKVPHTANTPFEFDSTGDLIVHGVTNAINMAVKIDRVDAAKLKITGKTPLKMSDYKVKPPCPTIPGLGQITTGDDITVVFEWIVTRPETNLVEK